MDFSKLSSTEKLAVYGSVAVIVGGLVGYSYGLTVLAVLAAIVMLVIVLLPQLSPSTTLPGSRGSLMVAVGGLAGIVMLLALLVSINTVFLSFNFRDAFFLIAVAGGLLMAWSGWQAFQAEGGKFNVGTTASSSSPAASTPAATSDPAPSEPVASTPAPATDPAPSDPVADTRDDDRPEA